MPIPLLIAAAGLCIDHVHDGDTFTLCSHERVRIANIDAPEVEGSERCAPRERQRLGGSRNPAWCDYALGDASTRALEALMAGGGVALQRMGYDRYGRILATVSVNGRDAGAYLIARGLARPWR